MSKHLLKGLHSLQFRTKITLGMALMLIFSGLSIGLLLSAMSSRALLDEGKKRGMALSAGLAFRLAEPLLAMDFLQMKNLIDNTHHQYGDVLYIFLTDTSGNVLSHTFSGGGFPHDLLRVNRDSRRPQPLLLETERGAVYDFNVGIILGEKNLGSVRLGLSRSKMDAQIRQQRLISLVGTLGVVSLGIVLALWFARTVTLRLNRLRESAEEIVKGNLNVQVGVPLEKNCWDIMECAKLDCPAHGDTRRRCWYLAGTLCPHCRGKEYPLKIESCRHCPVFRYNFGDEIQDLAEAFDVMAVTIKNHIEELTEREKTIARQQELLKTIMNVTPDFITLQDKELTYRFASKAFCDYFNLNEDEVIGKTDFDIFSERQADLNFHEDKQILLTGHSLAKEITFKRPDGQRWFHIVKVPVADQDGGIMGLLLTARDISMLKKIQEQLIQSQKMEDLGRLAGGVAHEINTPLGIILGYTQLLMDDITDQELLENLQVVEKQAKICRKIVADLLGFSRHSQSVREAVDLNGSLREVVQLVEHAFSLKGITIIQHLDETVPPLDGNKERLKQVWLNLLNNGADAIGQDGVIVVRSRRGTGGQIEVSVADTGQGVTQGNLNKIFDPFFTTKQVGKGTGLGLSVSFGIIKEHGGTISAQSPAPVEYLAGAVPPFGLSGPGTVFLVELPPREVVY
ncbi:two-component system sensor histidine kinase NtrB [Desulfobulbus elongatus]|uniref:two-component system sensor histidine kinase NtrB n=1 Tax=Desulfobulbus elongatus TaxID=53332 RepID=UPI000B2399CC|nr:ATP-binding protein [Desulfobulbus elongatus]